MRRASYTPLTPMPPTSEPLIVVEESGGADDEGGGDGGDDDSRPASPPGCDSPLLNPCLLSPYRDMRKRSLPTPACTSGITASQVRRLSEHGVGCENAAAAAREAAFLATLQQAPPVPQTGGRRHSVVTISRAPQSSVLFGRGRRESIAAFTAGALPQRVLPPRRDSTSAVPPRPPATSGASAGSTHNLQLDIMDDIAEIKAARKVRLKMWRTPSRERMCEVQPLEGTAAEAGPSDAAGPSGTQPPPTRYQSRGGGMEGAAASRRYSDFALISSGAPCGSGATGGGTPAAVATAGAAARRRASELPPGVAATAAAAAAMAAARVESAQRGAKSAGIVCTNSDLISILSSLASSAQEINRDPDEDTPSAPVNDNKRSPTMTPGPEDAGGGGAESQEDQKRFRLKGLRSNSFDVSMLLGTSPLKENLPGTTAAASESKSPNSRSGSVVPASWFTRRHQPKGTSAPLKDEKPSSSAIAAMAEATAQTALGAAEAAGAVVWDGRSGSVVDAQVLGSAIEDFLARRGSSTEGSVPSSPAPGPSPSQSAGPGGQKPSSSTVKAQGSKSQSGGGQAGGSWFSKEEDDASASDTCDSSICSTLKDLFVK